MGLRGTISKAIKRAAKRFGPRAVILMYHRVAPKDLDPWSLGVTPEHFAEQLEVLRKHTRPVALRELAQAQRAGRLPDRAAAVTFDDGYANNLYNAKPLLERYGQPATVFVTTDYVGSGREFWWDELDRILLTPGRLPEVLDLDIGGRPGHWELKRAAEYTPDEYRSDTTQAGRETNPSARLAFYYSLWKALQPLPSQRRENALEVIRVWAQANGSPRDSHRPMESSELGLLERNGLIDIGAHTATHPLLSAHPVSLQRAEIVKSKRYLERALGHSVTTFAYPFGDYSKDTIPLLGEAGFACACACSVPETVSRRSDLLQLPRFEVQDWPGDVFERRLLQWLKS